MIRKPFFSLSVLAALCVLTAAQALAQQQQAPPNKLQRVLAHMDIALNGVGDFTKTVKGTNYQGTTFEQQGSNTFGGLFTIRATKSPWVGAEINLGYQRFTQTYSCPGVDPANDQTQCVGLGGGLQANMEEFTFGYLVHPPTSFMGAKPFLSAGSGVMAFKPTSLGGQGYNTQARQTYYYTAGVDYPAFADFFAIRVGFRQNIYLAPDFGQNYLKIKQHTFTSQPEIGFVFHF